VRQSLGLPQRQAASIVMAASSYISGDVGKSIDRL